MRYHLFHKHLWFMEIYLWLCFSVALFKSLFFCTFVWFHVFWSKSFDRKTFGSLAYTTMILSVGSTADWSTKAFYIRISVDQMSVTYNSVDQMSVTYNSVDLMSVDQNVSCLSTKCLSTECLSTKCLSTKCLSTECLSTKYLSTKCLSTKCLSNS